MKTKFLTGMRGYAALGVLVYHQGGAGLLRCGGIGKGVCQDLRFGVVLFFVLSAFTLCMSLERNPHYGQFFRRRFFRIAPLYYFMCGVSLLVPPQGWATMFGIGHDALNVFLHLTFLGIFDIRYYNSLIGVEWTICVEVLFYLLLPLLIRLSTLRLITLTGLFYLTKFVWGTDHEWVVNLFSPQVYGFCFVIGILAYRLYSSIDLERLQRNWTWLVTMVVYWGVLIVRHKLRSVYLFPYPFMVHFYALLTAWVILTSGGRNRISKLLFENPVAIWLGTISYSIYLLHQLVLRYLPSLSFPSIFAVVVALSTVTYFCIERPFIQLGRYRALVYDPG